MSYLLNDIARIITAECVIVADSSIEQLLLDSRKLISPATSLFFALKSDRRDGHRFIPELYKKGVRNFVCSEKVNTADCPRANFLFVKDTMAALQELTSFHRRRFAIPVIGITGSNGKTIVKEWLYQLLNEDYNIVRSPRSYNSQIGVPLSIWQMNEQHTLGIFEAGISQPGEMIKLEKIIRPTIGIVTAIGEAHSKGFLSQEQKEKEKNILLRNAVSAKQLTIEDITKETGYTSIFAQNPAKERNVISIRIPFMDDASVQNAITCWRVMLMLGYDNEVIKERMKVLAPVNMRLELKKGINNCSIINDSYSADLSSLEIALNFLDQQSGSGKKTVVLSDFLQSAKQDEELYTEILSLLRKHGVTKLVAIGERIMHTLEQLVLKNDPELQIELFSSTQDFIKQFRSSQFKEETILIKGARIFAFEQIVQVMEQKVHQTVLEVNLSAIVSNLKEYQRILKPSTKVMAMVKAFAYGSGGAEIAGILQYHKVDYLGVAYADEGIELRRAGILLPIMVMNPEENAFDSIVENNLEPEIYSFELFQAFDAFCKNEGLHQYPVHVEIETGMNRLGFDPNDIGKLADLLLATTSFNVRSVFSHLAASEDPQQDEFTRSQFAQFDKAVDLLEEKLGYSFIRHIANSAAVVRHPQLQLDMVRLGIGLYGVDSADSHKLNLQTVATLRSTVAQVKHLRSGESVSYNRKGLVVKDTTIATVRLGYADGYPRRLGNGIGQVFIKGKLAPVIGTVCMDMFMIDISDIPGVVEGDEVIIFGKQLPVEKVADWAGTIPYEIMTGVSQRVKRVYFEE